MNDLTLDGGRALRLAAIVALVVLGVTTVPGLFRTPEPPPVPADVGFRPGETVSAPPPAPEVRAPSRSGNGSKREKGKKGGVPRPERPPERRREPDSSGRERPEAIPAPAPVATPQPAPAAPPPVYVPPPTPAPAPALPADGSEEFAPGRAG